MPKFRLKKIEDYYTYYVLIMGIDEDTFWNASLPFLQLILDNKSAYDSWLGSVAEKEREHGR